MLFKYILYNIQTFKMAAAATTVLQETKPEDWAACAIFVIDAKQFSPSEFLILLTLLNVFLIRAT